MKNGRVLSENFQFLEVKFSIYLNRRVFVMMSVSSGSMLQDIVTGWTEIYFPMRNNVYFISK